MAEKCWWPVYSEEWLDTMLDFYRNGYDDFDAVALYYSTIRYQNILRSGIEPRPTEVHQVEYANWVANYTINGFK